MKDEDGRGLSAPAVPAANPASVSIVVPTLREAANLRPLAERIAGALAGNDIAWELLLIDDDSDDGSADVAVELAQRLPVRMQVRRGVPPDLSCAVIEGIARGAGSTVSW